MSVREFLSNRRLIGRVPKFKSFAGKNAVVVRNLALTGSLVFTAPVSLAMSSSVTASSPARSRLIVLPSFASYSSWSPERREIYISSLRQAWTEFEDGVHLDRSSPLALREDDPHAVPPSLSTGRSALTRFFGGLNWLPSAHAVEAAYCPVGGGEREMVRDADGVLKCPTTGRDCGSGSISGAAGAGGGFQCFEIYNNVCVARLPLTTLTERCDQAAQASQSGRLTSERFEKIRATVSTVLRRCRSGEYDERFKDNCDRFAAQVERNSYPDSGKHLDKREEIAMTYEAHEVEMWRRGIDRLAAPYPSTPVRKGWRSRACFPERSYKIYYNMGGRTDVFLHWADMIKRSGAGIEILGTCASACQYLVAHIPADRVCVGPRAALGFHYARDRYNRIAYDYSDRQAEQFYSPLRDYWRRVKGIGHPLQMKYLYGSELRKVYPSCSERKRETCGETSGASSSSAWSSALSTR